MNKRLKFFSTCLIVTFSSWNTFAEPTNEPENCKVIVQALEAAKSLKAGMTRADVEKDFRLDGGVAFSPNDRYVYRKCPYIKVDVEFRDRDIAKTPQTSSKDQVTGVSRPYLDYPLTD